MLPARLQKYHILGLSLVMALIHYLLFKNKPFFWDSTQLVSMQAHYFFENGFNNLVLPELIDSGHPPIVGIYIAWIWKLFGRTLEVSHLAFLPFVFTYYYISGLWLKQIIFDKILFWSSLILVWFDPLFLAQSILMSPDIVLIGMLMMLLYAYKNKRNIFVAIASLVIAMVSMRGAMVLFGIGIFHILYSSFIARIQLKDLFIRGLYLLPGVVFILFFFGYHYLSTGWIGYHAHSPWAASFERVDLNGFFKNLGIIGFRFLDFGRILFWLIIGYFLHKSNNILKNPFIVGVLLFVCIGMVLLPNMLSHKHLSANRYLWPMYLLLVVGAVYALQNLNISRKLMAGFALLLLVSNLYFLKHYYPINVSRDWESNIAYLDYETMRKEVTNYCSNNDIRLESVGTVFPSYKDTYYTHLTKYKSSMKILNINTDTYVFTSNIHNDLKKNHLDEIEEMYLPIFETQIRQIEGVLWKKKSK